MFIVTFRDDDQGGGVGARWWGRRRQQHRLSQAAGRGSVGGGGGMDSPCRSCSSSNTSPLTGMNFTRTASSSSLICGEGNSNSIASGGGCDAGSCSPSLSFSLVPCLPVLRGVAWKMKRARCGQSWSSGGGGGSLRVVLDVVLCLLVMLLLCCSVVKCSGGGTREETTNSFAHLFSGGGRNLVAGLDRLEYRRTAAVGFRERGIPRQEVVALRERGLPDESGIMTGPALSDFAGEYSKNVKFKTKETRVSRCFYRVVDFRG